MEKKLKSIGVNLGSSALMIGAACIGTAYGSPMIGTVVGGILTGLATNRIESAQLHKLKQILGRTNPSELNHDLEKTIAEALDWTVKNITGLYEPYSQGKEQKELLSEIKDTLLAQVKAADKKDWLKNEEILNQINEVQAPQNLLRSFVKDLESLSPINELKPFPAFFEERFFENFQLCFGELLKKPEKHAALVAYNRNVSTQIQKNLNANSTDLHTLKDDNKVIKEALVKLASTTSERIEKDFVMPQIKIELDQFLEPLEAKVDLVVDSNGKILKSVEELKRELGIQTQQIHGIDQKLDKSLKRNRLYYFLIPLGAITIAYFAYRYWQLQQPFIFTVAIENTTPTPNLPTEASKISFHYGDKTEIQESLNETVFKNLPSSLRGDSARISVETYGFYTLDTLIALDQNHINLAITRDDTYDSMQGTVKDALTGTRIANATVQVLDLSTETDRNGQFKLSIPLAKQNTEQRLSITKTGYKEWVREEPVLKNIESIIQLEKP